MPERFYKQEYEAVFLDDGGVVFRNVERVCRGESQDTSYKLQEIQIQLNRRDAEKAEEYGEETPTLALPRVQGRESIQ